MEEWTGTEERGMGGADLGGGGARGGLRVSTPQVFATLITPGLGGSKGSGFDPRYPQPYKEATL